MPIQNEDLEIIKQAKKGDEKAVESICKKYRLLIYKLAYQFTRLGATFEDSVQAGYVGLLGSAIPKYNLDSGLAFITFAYNEIRDAIQQAANDSITTVNLPSRTINYTARFIEAEKAHAQKFEESPSWEDLVKDEDIDPKSASALTYLFEFNSSTQPNVIETREDKTNDFEIKNNEIDVGILLSTLRKQEADIIKRCFGIGTEKETLEEIGMRHNISPERVRQIRDETIAKLQESARRLETFNPNAKKTKRDKKDVSSKDK